MHDGLVSSFADPEICLEIFNYLRNWFIHEFFKGNILIEGLEIFIVQLTISYCITHCIKMTAFNCYTRRRSWKMPLKLSCKILTWHLKYLRSLNSHPILHTGGKGPSSWHTSCLSLLQLINYVVVVDLLLTMNLSCWVLRVQEENDTVSCIGIQNPGNLLISENESQQFSSNKETAYDRDANNGLASFPPSFTSFLNSCCVDREQGELTALS